MHTTMKKQFSLLLITTLLTTLTQIHCASRPSSGLRSANPEELGLRWRECAISQGFTGKEAETCFGHSIPLWSESEKARFGIRLDDGESLELTIGQDVYRASLSGAHFQKNRYTLYKNDRVVRSLWGEFTAHSPNISLQNVGGKAVWEFSDGNRATIIYDGSDVRQLYGLDRAYRPYGLADKLIFIGERDAKYFVVYDGWKVGPDFDQIVIAYCCEAALWSVQYGQGRYLFWGSRNGQGYVVEIALRGNSR